MAEMIKNPLSRITFPHIFSTIKAKLLKYLLIKSTTTFTMDIISPFSYLIIYFNVFILLVDPVAPNDGIRFML